MNLVDMEELIKRGNQIKEAINTIEKGTLSSLRKELSVIDAKLIDTLQAHGMKSYKGANGAVTAVTRYSYKIPKTLEDKKEFLDWLRESMGEVAYWQSVGVNSMKLNSICKEVMEEAKANKDIDFRIPGLTEPEATVIIQRRK